MNCKMMYFYAPDIKIDEDALIFENEKNSSLSVGR